MKSLAPTLLLLFGCFVAPELIEDDGGTSLDVGLAVDGGNSDIGRAVDAGTPTWLIEPPSGTILGAASDLEIDTSGVQVELLVQGLVDTEFGFYANDELLAAGGTDADGRARVTVTLLHGRHELELRAGTDTQSHTLLLDTVSPTLDVEVESEPARLPWLTWTDVSDADGVGSNDDVQVELQINDGPAQRIETILGNDGGGRLRGLNLGTHNLRIRASDEAGNRTEIQRQVTVGLLQKRVLQRAESPLATKPCVGDVNGSGLADLILVRSYALGTITVNIGSILAGNNGLSTTTATTFTLMGRNTASCLIAPLIDNGRNEIVIASTGSQNDGRFEFLNWSTDAGEIRTFHVMTESRAIDGSVGLNMAFYPGGLAALPGSESVRDALVLQTGTRFLRFFDLGRLNHDSPSQVSDVAPNSLVIQLANNASSDMLAVGDYTNTEQPALAIVDRRADEGDGAVWVLNSGLSSGQSYALNENESESPFSPTLRGGSSGMVGNYPRTVRLSPDGTDGILTTYNNRTQLIVHQINSEPILLDVPETVGLISDLSACDLNGDGRDEISVVGGLRHEIRWGDGSWTSTPIQNRPKYTVCTPDIDGDDVNDLVVATYDNRNSVFVLH